MRIYGWHEVSKSKVWCKYF